MQIRSDSLMAAYSQRLAARGGGVGEPAEEGFASLLADGVRGVNGAQADSQAKIEQLLSGGDVESAEVITSMQKADMAFRLLVQVRNKLMKAYEEIQAIQV